MDMYVRHIALVVQDLQVAEAYYRSLFQMDLLGRETQLEDGRWFSLPTGMGSCGSLCPRATDSR